MYTMMCTRAFARWHSRSRAWLGSISNASTTRGRNSPRQCQESYRPPSSSPADSCPRESCARLSPALTSAPPFFASWQSALQPQWKQNAKRFESPLTGGKLYPGQPSQRRHGPRKTPRQSLAPRPLSSSHTDCRSSQSTRCLSPSTRRIRLRRQFASFAS